MPLDGRTVGRALADVVWPHLKEYGFTKFQGRHSWRPHALGIDLVTFPSVNAYIASGVGCTSFSFSGEVGVYYPGAAFEEHVAWPRGYHLTLRGLLAKSIRQPFFHPFDQHPSTLPAERRDRPDVWYVLEDGSNLEEVARDALRSVLEQGVPFIDRASDPGRAIEILRGVPSSDRDFGVLGFLEGTIGSPWRTKVIDHLSTLLESPVSPQD